MTSKIIIVSQLIIQVIVSCALLVIHPPFHGSAGRNTIDKAIADKGNSARELDTKYLKSPERPEVQGSAAVW